MTNTEHSFHIEIFCGKCQWSRIKAWISYEALGGAFLPDFSFSWDFQTGLFILMMSSAFYLCDLECQLIPCNPVRCSAETTCQLTYQPFEDNRLRPQHNPTPDFCEDKNCHSEMWDLVTFALFILFCCLWCNSYMCNQEKFKLWDMCTKNIGRMVVKYSCKKCYSKAFKCLPSCPFKSEVKRESWKWTQERLLLIIYGNDAWHLNTAWRRRLRGSPSRLFLFVCFVF